MQKRNLDITETELAVLDVLWRQRRATIRQITDELYSRRTTSEYATVQKLLERLEAKNCVTRDRSSFAHVFSSKIKRVDLLGSELEQLAQRLCDGSLTPMLMHLAGTTQLTPQDRDMLRRMIEDAPSSTKKKRRKS